ncbi:hypothetical protein MMC11_000055 [Xylographa trunciseda]|nr:hypothetical protein [Xylographa trunciseda]
MSVVPAPLPVAPSEAFDGVDGNWSSFTIRIGNPPSNSRVLVSTLIPETWVVNGPYYCTENSATNCSATRGTTFSPAGSSTWEDQSTFTLGVDTALGMGAQDAGDYGYDTVGIQITGETPILLDHQVVVAMDTTDFWLGYLGLAPRTPQFGNSTQPSLLTSLKNKNSIPSLSYGYTAGASYRSQTASLTLGGYDASMFVPNDVSFGLSQVDTRDIVVGLQSISFSSSNTTETPLLEYGSGFLTFIDTTLPNIWLPENVCNAFAQAFGLQYDALHLRYTINDTMHDANIKAKASATFQLANFVTGGSSVNITLPYSSFDLTLSPPQVTNATRYFPIRQANEGAEQYTLGRAFLQEAYLTVDYGNQNFSVSQVDTSGKPSHIVAISDANSTSPTAPGSTSSGSATPSSTSVITVSNQSSGLSSSAIAGIAIGIVAIALLAASAVIFVIWRNRKRRRQAAEPRAELPADSKSPTDGGDRGYYPIGSYQQKQLPMIGVTRKGDELDGRAVSSPLTHHNEPNTIPMVELSGSVPARAELHSPEPDRSRSPTLVNQNRGSMITPTPDHPREPWTTRLEMPSPGLSSRDSIAAADNVAHPVAHSPELLPSPETEAPSPRAGSSTSAFQSPTIGYTRFGMTTPPPISPDSHQVVTPERETDSFFTHSDHQPHP